jgi:hypothetical protein
MGNPHPSKSKPFKIGRKHTGALSTRARGRLVSRAKKVREIELNKFRQHKARVSAFWRGEIEEFPNKTK